MASELEALLALQQDDDVVHAVELERAALEPRLQSLEVVKSRLVNALTRAEQTLATDEARQREIEARLTDHKDRQQRNLAHLDVVKKMREATAAIAQVEQARRLLLEEESEVQTLSRDNAAARESIAAQQAALAELEREQADERAAIAADRADIDARLATAVAKRTESARGVPRRLLANYERIRGRMRDQAVFPLRGPSCGHCDTAIPLQRRSAMQHGGDIEVCEACGVLLYATG